MRQIREAHLDELVRVPLLATIAAIIFHQQGDRPLPDNQYELYESYLAFLRSARTATGPFEEHRNGLLEHLGRIRVETDTSLVRAAQAWVRSHVPPDDLADDWSTDLNTFLVSVGPLVVRGDDLRFLHHSFAEHLAATAKARELPEHFAEDHEEFVRLLYAARPKERGGYARAVVLHYTHLWPAEADPLVRWLHAGDAEQHLLAARLLAKRVPASEEAVDAFLTTVWGWAMTTRYPGGEILAQTSRAAHHPGLIGWLVALMRAETAPWQSRTEAAAALATRLRGEHSPEAVAVLAGLVDDPNTSVSQRLAAAEALADCGADERAAAERGLRAVLANPLASGFNCRTAAVILAAFGTEPRECAVTTLSRLSANRDRPPPDLIEAATGLIEIGAEFHDNAAEVFRELLRDPVDNMVGRRNAALGLASLGPEHNDEAAAALTDLIADRRRSRVNRAGAAQVLGELGPQHRLLAADRLTAVMGEPGMTALDRWQCATRLADFGTRFKDLAAAELRSLIADRGATANNVTWAIKSLADLGPDLFEEAGREAWRLLSEAHLDGFDRVLVLGNLVELGEPHRTRALRELRDRMTDQGAAPDDRCQAAERLIRSGPEFHAEAGVCLLQIATTAADTVTALRAWREMLSIGTEFHDEALAALLDAALTNEPDALGGFGGASAFAASDAEHVHVAEALLAVLGDPSRNYQTRMSAATALVQCGSRFHRAMVTRMCDLLRSATVPGFDFPYVANVLSGLGAGLREELIQPMREVLSDPRSPSIRIRKALTALDKFGHATEPSVVAALRTVVADGTAELEVRNGAGAVLARIAPEHEAEVVAEVLLRPVNANGLRDAVLALAEQGADVVPGLRALLADADTRHSVRRVVASLLHVLSPADRNRALAELRRQAEDEYLDTYERGYAFSAMAELDPSTADRALAYHRCAIADEREDLRDRSIVIGRLIKLDRTFGWTGLTMLRRFARNPHSTHADRVSAAQRLVGAGSPNIDEAFDLAVVIARDVRTAPGHRRWLIERLPRRYRTEVERHVLADHSLPIDQRVPRADGWDDLPLAADAEAAIRDVLDAPGTPPRERIAAASALAELSLRLVPEAVVLLRGLARERRLEGLRALAKPAPRYREEVLSQALDITADRGLPPRERCRAAHLVADITTNLPEPAADFLREVVADARTSDRDRMKAAVALVRTDGLTTVRAMRDDERKPAATRWKAATELVDYGVEDRAAAARVLHAIAVDATIRPALRRRAGEDLARLGKRGRERAEGVLLAMAADDTLPVTARVGAARTLNEVAPACRRAAMKSLRDLLTTPNPLHRRQVLLAIGELDPGGAALELVRMSRDGRLGPVARVWCAEAVAELSRDDREAAAAVVRAVAHDESAPRHVRRRAARDLAQWSALCRAEARAVIRALTG